ncbi:CCR4-NOT transcription complex subunit 2 [Aphanomyces cochlioides]|nr:CCR4-NOT transcription complex subunit 2 [Aphanomyces cochlioides]
MRECFENITRLIIAHRLDTIMDSDRILVLDAGTVKEYGTPSELLANKNGAFTQLAQHANIDVDKQINITEFNSLSLRPRALVEGDRNPSESKEELTMTDLPPHLVASYDRINAALEVAVQQPPPATGTLRVCLATEEEWNAFADCDGQVVRPNFLKWFDDSGEIHIIELDSTPHAKYIWRLSKRFHEDDVERWLIGYLSATNSQGRRACPDLSYGPSRRAPHSVLPPGVPIFADFRTIKIEIGVSQTWGMAPGQLDHKVLSTWAVMPGVEYVLCVKFDPDFANAEYKLYDVRADPLVPLAPFPIVAPRTETYLDGCRILGIPQGMPLPEGFPRALPVDLYSPLQWAMS